jgi:hypothetical protein
MKHRVRNRMARIANKSAVNSSPGLKSQVSAEGDSDIENMGDPLASQTNFATQVPFSPPKPLERGSPRQGKLLGKRKVMADLRPLVGDGSRAPKKNKSYNDEVRAISIQSNMQRDIEWGGIKETSGKKSECAPSEQDTACNTSRLGRPPQRKASLQDVGAADDGTTNRGSPPSSTSNVISEVRVPRFDDRVGTLPKWQDRLSKTTYLPRYLQTISKAQNDLLSADDSWQPGLVGQPTRPGTLPLDLLNSLTAAADQKAAVVRDRVDSTQRVSAGVQVISQGEADGVDEDTDSPPKSPILRTVAQEHDQDQSEAQEAESESEGSPVDWSSTPPRSSLLRPRLPPDSSPLQAPQGISLWLPFAEGASRLIRKSEYSMLSNPVQLSSLKDVEQSSQPFLYRSNSPEGPDNAHITNAKTSSNLQERPASRSLKPAEGTSIFQAEANSASHLETKFPSFEHETTTFGLIPIINSSDDFARRVERNDSNIIQVSDTPDTARPPSSSAPHSRQITKYSLDTLLKQSTSQRPPPLLSPQLIPGTSLQESVNSRLTGSLRDLHLPKESMDEFEINSSEDGSVHDECTAKPLSENQDQDGRANASRQGILEIQIASQVPPDASRYPEVEGSGTTAHSDRACSYARAVSDDRVVAAPDSKSLGKRRLDNTNEEELPKHSKPANPIISSPVLSVSSDEPDFRRVDNMTRQYRRVVYSTFRKIETAAPFPPATLLASNVSPISESLQSSDRRHSAETSILRQVTTSTPLTNMSAQARNDVGERPALTSDMSKRGSQRPKDQFLAFKQNYPTYGGNFTQFLISCRMIKKVRTAGKLLPQGVWDDFVHRHNHDYRSYLDEITQSNELESPIPYEEYYVDFVSEPVHLKGVLKLSFIDALSAEMDLSARLDSTPLRTASEAGHVHGQRRSIAVGSSASNVRPRESLTDKPDKTTRQDDSMKLEIQVQLKEKEEARQSQSSSVHLWLQKATGVASPELGTPDRLAAPSDISYIDLTENEESLTFDLARELQTLKLRSANTKKGCWRASPEKAQLPDAKAEPFKYFSFGHARLDVDIYGTSPVQTDAKGALRPALERIIDIFTWRSSETCV